MGKKKWEGTEVKIFSERNVDFSIQEQALVNLSAGIETGSSSKQGKNMFKLEFIQIGKYKKYAQIKRKKNDKWHNTTCQKDWLYSFLLKKFMKSQIS